MSDCESTIGLIVATRSPLKIVRSGPVETLRTSLRLAFYCISLCSVVGAQSLTTVNGTIEYPNGTRPSGNITISWFQFLNAARQKVAQGQTVVPVSSGVFTVNLTPTDTAIPTGTCYRIAYRLNGVSSQRTWLVPTSSVPVNYLSIESDIACVQQQSASIALGQLTNSGATVGQVPTWNGTYWAPAAGGGGGGGNPGGNNGQLQFNSLGAFGGFTPGGDLTFNNPNFIVTKTNGVAFAPSATIDTTNAANISVGQLAPARGGTGAGQFSQGSIPFVGASGVYQQENANLFWQTGTGLGVFRSSPVYQIDVGGVGATVAVRSTTGSNAAVILQSGTANGWLMAGQTDGTWTLYDPIAATNPITVRPGAPSLSMFMFSTGNISLGSGTDGGYKLDVTKSGSSGTARFYDQTATTGSTNVVFRNGPGQSTSPSVTWYNNAGTVLSFISYLGEYYSYSAGVAKSRLGQASLLASSDFQACWGNNVDLAAGTADACIGRNAPGVLEINNGTPGTFRDLTLRSLTSNTLITGAAATMSGLTTTATLNISGLIGGGAQCLTVDNSGNVSGTGSACGSGGSSGALSGLTAATGANTIANSDNAQVWNWTLTTNSKIAFKFGEGAASAATTPVLVQISTLATSTAIPFKVTAGGTANGVQVSTAGVLSKIGSGQVNADHYNGNAVVGVVDGGTGLATYSSGGVICATAATTLASSSALTANGVVIGGGVGSCPTSISAGGGGTLLQGVAASAPTMTATPTLGIIGSVQGQLKIAGSTSGLVTIQTAAAAGTFNFNLPITAGSAGQFLTSAGGGSSAMTWTTAGAGTVTVVASGTLTSTALVTGGGTTTLQTPSATSTLDSNGNLSLPGTAAFGVGSGFAGMPMLFAGTAQTPDANSIGLSAPTSVTAYRIDFASAAGTGYFYGSNSSNVVTQSFLSTSFSTLTDGATITWALASAPLANAVVTLAGNRTLNITNPVNGGSYLLKIIQDGTGSRSLTLGTGCTWKVVNGGSGAITLTTTAGATDILAIQTDGTNCYAALGANFN